MGVNGTKISKACGVLVCNWRSDAHICLCIAMDPGFLIGSLMWQ